MCATYWGHHASRLYHAGAALHRQFHFGIWTITMQGWLSSGL
jgi:hypothetical protein